MVGPWALLGVPVDDIDRCAAPLRFTKHADDEPLGRVTFQRQRAILLADGAGKVRALRRLSAQCPEIGASAGLLITPILSMSMLRPTSEARALHALGLSVVER